MDDLPDGMQKNWYTLGNLLSQFAFLAAGVWFARKILKTMRASQEQVGALLKLSVTGAITDRHSSSAVADRPFASASPYWLTPTEIPPVAPPDLPETGPSRWAIARHAVAAPHHRLMGWLQPPMSRARAPPPSPQPPPRLQTPPPSPPRPPHARLTRSRRRALAFSRHAVGARNSASFPRSSTPPSQPDPRGLLAFT